MAPHGVADIQQAVADEPNSPELVPGEYYYYLLVVVLLVVLLVDPKNPRQLGGTVLRKHHLLFNTLFIVD